MQRCLLLFISQKLSGFALLAARRSTRQKITFARKQWAEVARVISQPCRLWLVHTWLTTESSHLQSPEVQWIETLTFNLLLRQRRKKSGANTSWHVRAFRHRHLVHSQTCHSLHHLESYSQNSLDIYFLFCLLPLHLKPQHPLFHTGKRGLVTPHQ